MIMPIIGGYIVDVIGVRTGNLIFCSLVAVGQFVFAFGVMLTSYPAALVGRFLYGLGGESLGVSSNYFLIGWFKGKELATAIGTTVTVSSLSSAINDNAEPAIVSKSGSLSLGLWVGFLFCIISLFLAVILNYLDKQKDLKLKTKEKSDPSSSEKFKCSDVKSFNACYWLICLNCLAVYVDISCFNNVASNYFQKRFGYTSEEAGSIMSITFIVLACFCPFFGMLVDRFGHRAEWIMLSSVLVSLVHVAFLLTPDSDRSGYPISYMVVLGLGYSICASVIWSTIPYLVQIKAAGTAYGMATAIQNLGLGVGPIIVGVIQQNSCKDHGYFWVSFLFVVIGGAAVLISGFILCWDKKNGRVLKSSKKKGKNQVFITTSDGD